MRGNQHLYIVGGSVNWYNLSRRHFGKMHEKSLRRHIRFDPVIPCIKFNQGKELIHLNTKAYIKCVQGFCSLKYSMEFEKLEAT